MLKTVMLLTIIFGLIGCSDKTIVREAWTEKPMGDSTIVHVRLAAKDAEFIKREQTYFSIVVNECGSTEKRFPMEPLIDGRRASDFAFRVLGPETDFTAVAPTRVMRGYRTPCVTLEGGGYAGARLKSKQVPLELEKS